MLKYTRKNEDTHISRKICMKNNVDVKLRPLIHACSEICTIVPIMQGIHHKKHCIKIYVKFMDSSKLQQSDSIENGYLPCNSGTS